MDVDLDHLAEWLERHPEIAEIVVTEVTTVTEIFPKDLQSP